MKKAQLFPTTFLMKVVKKCPVMKLRYFVKKTTPELTINADENLLNTVYNLDFAKWYQKVCYKGT